MERRTDQGPENTPGAYTIGVCGDDRGNAELCSYAGSGVARTEQNLDDPSHIHRRQVDIGDVFMGASL